MQNRPSQVRNCTGASWRMVSGMSRIAAKISDGMTGARCDFSPFMLPERRPCPPADIPSW